MKHTEPSHLKTVRELYLEQRQIAPADFEQDLLQRTLYPHARLLHRLMPASACRRYFSIDLEFVRAIGLLRNRRDFRGECLEFQRDPANHKFSRSVLRLRISGGRTRQVVDDLFEAEDSHPPV